VAQLDLLVAALRLRLGVLILGRHRTSS